jgi:hypothetical protein
MSNRNLAATLRVLTFLGALLVVLMPTLGWLGAHQGMVGPRQETLGQGVAASREVALAIVLPPYLIVAWGLVQLSGFCNRLGRGDHFSRAASTALKRFGWSLIAAAVVLPISRLALRAYMTEVFNWWELFAGVFRTLPVLASALGLIVGLIMIVFAVVLEQATELAEENARFI